MFWRSLKSFIRSRVASVDGRVALLSRHSEIKSQTFVNKVVDKSENSKFSSLLLISTERRKETSRKLREQNILLHIVQRENSCRTCDCVGAQKRKILWENFHIRRVSFQLENSSLANSVTKGKIGKNQNKTNWKNTWQVCDSKVRFLTVSTIAGLLVFRVYQFTGSSACLMWT